jgi:hypothetical protein
LSIWIRRLVFPLSLALAALTAGCSMTQMTADMTVDVMWEASASIPQEGDTELAELSIATNLKMMEGLALISPENPKLLRMLSEGFSSYAFAFLEPRAWKLVDSESYQARRLQGRIKRLHQRATRYARQRLKHLLPDVEARLEGPIDALTQALADDFDDDELDSLFWLGHCWSLWVAADPEDLENVASMGAIDVLLGRVYREKPAYEDGGLATYFGSAHAVLGVGIAGDLAPAKEKFEQAIQVTEGAYLLPRFLMGLHYCRAMTDKKCFVDAMSQVLEADPDRLPRRRLTNVLVQGWAHHWLTKADAIF